MKLRYYLRGLGVGILLATIILTIANRDNQPMTDAEVRARAAELGMVESGSVRLSEMTVGESVESAAETSMESTAEAQESSVEALSEAAEGTAETQESSAEPSSEAAESTAEAQESSVEPSSEAAESAAETQESSAEVSSAEPSSETAETVTFEIRSGSGSDTVSRNLAAAGLVADASAFDDYLCDNGYSRRIRVGTYEIPVGSTDEEIARIITGN